MKQIRTLNEKEKEIFTICTSGDVDLERIDYLLKNGADANGGDVEISENPKDIELDEGNEYYYDLLITQCWLDLYDSIRYDKNGYMYSPNPDMYLELLKVFVNNGLDIDKYAYILFDDLHFLLAEDKYIEITKYILNNIKNKDNVDFESCLENIGISESYLNCCECNHKSANILSTVYEMIEYYQKGYDHNLIYDYKNIINQKIKNIEIYYKDIKIDMEDKLISDSCEIIINCDKDKLDINNKTIFINNNNFISEYKENESLNRFNKRHHIFEDSINNYLKEETIKDIKIKNKTIIGLESTHYNLTIIEILTTNNKKIKIGSDESLRNMKVTIKK